MAGKDGLLLGSRRTGERRWRRRVGWTLLTLVIVLPLAYLVFLRWTAVRPPSVSDELRRAATALVPDQKGPRSYLGPNWVSRERGVWEIHLEGDPYTMGFAHARLGTRLLRAQEDGLFSEMNTYIPSRIARFFVRAGVRLKFRRLPAQLPADRALEMAGLAEGSLDKHDDFLPMYHRVVYYHALHEITQSLEQSPLIGCTAFAAAGPATVGGRLIVGRNFDFEGPEIFDRDKAVIFFKPTGKIPFASVAWFGMSGVVTGVNAEGIVVAVNAARTDDKGGDGVPVELLLREVLEQAHSLDEAIALIKKTPVIVPDFYLLGDGKTGESAVVERSPTRAEVRRAKDMTILANHALSQAFAGDAENDRLRRYLTSGARHKRMEELVRHWRGQIDARRALDILRDKRAAGGDLLGLGNRNAIDALIATHGVIIDATQMVLYVAEGPHLLGKFRAFDLKKELNGADARPNIQDLPEDSTLYSDEYRSYKDAMSSLRAAERLRGEKDLPRALDEARRAAGQYDKLPEAHKLLGDLLRQNGDKEAARREYQRFLELLPPHLKEVEEVRSLLATL